MSTKWNAKIQFPPDSDYIARIAGASFGPSKSSGNPMLTINWEVKTPAEKEVDGEMILLSGVKMDSYYSVKSFDANGKEDLVKTEKAKENVKELFRLLELNPDEINWDNIDTKPLLGKLCMVLITPDESPMRRNPTASQIEAAKKLGKRAEGDLMLNPKTKKPIIQYWPKVREVFGLAPVQDGVQVPY